MVLQGHDSSHQVGVAIAIHEQMPTTRFYFTSGYPHEQELAYARSRGLNLHFGIMPGHEQFLEEIDRTSRSISLLEK